MTTQAPNPRPTNTRDGLVAASLGRELLRSQIRRVTAMLALMGLLLVVIGLMRLELGLIRPELRARLMSSTGPVAALVGAYAVYEACVLVWLRRLRAQEATPGPFFAYLNALVEVSLPTLALLVLWRVAGGLAPLAGAIPFAYPLLIGLTALTLNPRLCLFAGGVGAAEFVAVALWIIAADPGTGALSTDTGMLASRHQYIIKGIMLASSGAIAAFIAVQMKGQLFRVLKTLDERDRVVSIFGQHVSPQVVELLLHQPTDFAGQERNVCVMFLDIRDFSRIAGERVPSEVMEYLNTLFGFMIPIINERHGIVNKFLGDGFMAVFGAPVDDGQQCRHAVAASMEILSGLEKLNSAGQIPRTRIGIGLHLGLAVTGNVGGSERKEYTVIGDVVNLASRIEQATKQFGAQLLVSESVMASLGGVEGISPQDFGPVELKGQAHPVRVFKLA